MPKGALCAEKLTAAERDTKIWELKVRGYSGFAISKETGIPETTVRRRLKIMLEKINSKNQELAENYRDLQTQRLETMLRQAFERGGILPQPINPETGEILSQKEAENAESYVLSPVDPAMLNAARAIIDSLSKLHALDKPIQIAPVNPDGSALKPADATATAITAVEAVRHYMDSIQQPAAGDSDE